VNGGTAAPGGGPFVWRDAGRVVLFGEGNLREAPRLLAEQGVEVFDLLGSRRTLEQAGELGAAATRSHEVPSGQVPAIAAALLGDAGSAEQLVALGGGRVIDVAKAIASVSGAGVAAIPTTMSGAEMTGIHRLPEGTEARVAGLVRPQTVIADPLLMTSQPERELRASSMNALAHGADSLYTRFANPVSRMTALRGAELIAAALDQAPETRDRAGLAVGSLLCGYAIDSGLFAIHHVICQTLVRVCGSTHAQTNAAILPRAMGFMAPRAPEEIADLAAAIGVDPADAIAAEPAAVEQRILELGGDPEGLGAAGADRSKLGLALDAILERPELGFAPKPPDRAELERLIDAAW
jgi:alcohol dehydrogenase class IV